MSPQPSSAIRPESRFARSLTSGRRRVFQSFALPTALCTSLTVALAQDAFAYCLQNGCEDGIRNVCDNFLDPNDCTEVDYVCERDENECINEGPTLHRLSNCMSFAVAKGKASELELTDQELHDIIDKAFKRWKNVDCGGGLHPGFEIDSAGLVTASGAYYCSNTALNQSTWFLSETWTRDPKALGFTFSTSGAKDGIVHDADVELNLDKIASDFAKNEWKAVLLSIATHEAGHFLGLAHSADSSAVMYAAYNRTSLHEREMTQDDFDGICAIFPPDPALECAPVEVVTEGLSEEACLTAMAEQEPVEEDTSTAEQGSEDPLGEIVHRRGCSLNEGRSSQPGQSGILAALLGVGLIVRRQKRCHIVG